MQRPDRSTDIYTHPLDYKKMTNDKKVEQKNKQDSKLMMMEMMINVMMILSFSFLPLSVALLSSVAPLFTLRLCTPSLTGSKDMGGLTNDAAPSREGQSPPQKDFTHKLFIGTVYPGKSTIYSFVIKPGESAHYSSDDMGAALLTHIPILHDTHPNFCPTFFAFIQA